MAFTYHRSITVDFTEVPSDQVDFPVVVNFTNTTLKSRTNGGHVESEDGFDIGFYADSGAAIILKWEMERYNPVTGEVVAWVKLPNISSTVPTVFYIFYGDASITTDQSDPTNVWSSAFMAAFHLKNGATLSRINSVTGISELSNNNVVTPAIGQIDGGAQFNASSSQWLEAASGYHPTSAMTISAWVNATSFPGAGVVESGFNPGPPFQSYQLGVRSDGKLSLNIKANSQVSYDGLGSHTLLIATWYYLSLTYDSVNGLSGYVNGVLDFNVAPNGPININFSPATVIGKIRTFSCCYWDGILDEVRFLNAGRSVDQLLIDYRNQISFGPFLTLGAEIAGTGACCLNGYCSITTEADCIASGGTYLGLNTECGIPNPCCGGLGVAGSHPLREVELPAKIFYKDEDITKLIRRTQRSNSMLENFKIIGPTVSGSVEKGFAIGEL